MGFQDDLLVKNLSVQEVQEMRVPSLGREDLLW